VNEERKPAVVDEPGPAHSLDWLLLLRDHDLIAEEVIWATDLDAKFGKGTGRRGLI
jgi:hypothetical protein